MRIPLVDLGAQHAAIAAEVEAGFARVIDKTAFILGDDVASFEAEFAQFSGARYCVGVASGTDAIELLVRAAGIGCGDEVILPANTFIATALAVMRAGATPVLVDSDPGFHLMDVARAAAAITTRTKALLPVHLYGQMADVDSFATQAAAAKIVLLEDAAQAQGATRHGDSVGRRSAGAATSFYPGKNLGAYGDGGAVLTSSEELCGKLRALRNHGSEVKYEHPQIGFNSRLDTLQAVVLRAKLKRLAGWNAARGRAAASYDALLGDCAEVRLPQTLAGNEHVWHLYVVRVPRRDAVLAHLQANGVGAGIHYPVPIHLQGALASLGYQRGDFPVAEAAAREVLSLPLFPEITAAQQTYVVAQLKAALALRSR